MPLNSRQIIQRPSIAIDPQFPMPQGLIDVYREDLPLQSDDYSQFDDDGSDLTGQGSVTYPAGTGSAFSPPDSVSVVSQTVRALPGGTRVVDLVFEVSGTDTATTYEVRVTKP